MRELPFFKLITFINLLLAFFIIASAALFNLKILQTDAPLELRENAMITTTDLMLKGDNPYDLKNMPAYVNSHGILYNLVVFPFAKIFGSTFLVHRLVSAAFILAAALLFFAALRWNNIPVSLSIIASSFLYAQLVTGGYDTTARADSVGFFLFLGSVVLPQKFKFKPYGLLLGFILCLLAFLAKQYFIISAVYLALYLFLFKSKKKGVIYALSTIISLGLLFFVISSIYQCYFLNTTYLLHIQATKDITHLFNQMKTFFQWNFASIIILFFLSLFAFIPAILKGKKNSLNLTGKMDLDNWKKPLLDYHVDFFAVALVVSTIAIVFKLGLNRGQNMTYFYHLLTPFLLLLAFKYLARQKNKIILLAASLLITAHLLFFIIRVISQLPEIPNDKGTWQKLEMLIAQHKNVYNSPETAYILSKQGKTIYDNGHSEFFVLGLVDNGKFPLVTGANEYFAEYVKGINQQIKEKRFDAIIVVRYILPYFSIDTLATYYKSSEIIPIKMLRETWYDEVWLPK